MIQFPLRSAFVAIPLEDAAKTAFIDFQNRLREYPQIFSFQNPDTPHLTLQFWRELLEIEYHQVREQLSVLGERQKPFTLKILDVNTFGSRGEDRVLYFSVPFSDELARLKKACPWVSVQPFHPHVTLARIRHPQRFAVAKKQILKSLKDASMTLSVDRLRLYGNVDGKAQTPISEVLLRGV